MKSNICLYCIQRYCCKLTEPILTVCPIFPNPPEEEPTHTQQDLWKDTIHWSSKDGCDCGGGT